MSDNSDGATEKSAASDSGQRETITVAARKPEIKSCKCNCDEKGYFAKKENWVSLGTLAALVIYTGFTFCILRSSQQQAVIISNQLILTNPPKLLVNNIAISPKDQIGALSISAPSKRKRLRGRHSS